MEISFNKSTTKRRTFLVWVTLALCLAILFTLLHLLLYFVFRSGEKTLEQHFLDFWIILAFYSIIFPASIAFSYRKKMICVIHDGEINPLLIKEYFIGRQFKVVNEEQNLYVLEATKKWEYLLTGKNSVRIAFNDKKVDITVPERYIYDLHHGFKFAKLFHKSS